MAIEQFGYRQQLRRSLSLSDLIIYGMIFMIPIAPFGVYGWVHADAHGMVPMAYLVGMLAMLFTALSYGAMAKAFPIAGSVYSYAQRGIHPHVGFIAGWVLLLDYLLIPPLLYVFSALALNHLFPAIPKLAWMLLFLVSATLVNLRGITFAARANLLFLIGELVVLAIFLVVGYQALEGGLGNGRLTLEPLYRPEAFDLGLVMKAASIAVLSFLGFDAVSTLAEETRDPQRDIPRAIVITTVGAGLLFTVLAVFSQLVFPGSVFQDAESAANEVMLAAGGKFLASFFTAAYVAGAAGSALASQASVSRILYSMGRDGILPRRVFGSLSERFKTPVIAILVVSVISLLAVVIDLTTLASMISFGALVAFSAVNLAVIRSYLLLDGRRAPRDLLRYGLVPAIGLGLTLWLWTSLSALTLVIGLTWFAAGLAYLALHTGGFRRKAPTVTFSEQN